MKVLPHKSNGLSEIDLPWLQYREAFLDRSCADRILAKLWDELEWAQKPLRMFGREVMQPRLTAWYGDPEACYTYSGISLTPMPWHSLLRELRDRLEAELNARFNSVLANAYRDGQDCMGWHSDDEPELGERPVIASLTLGAERSFILKPAESTRGESDRLHLVPAHGSLIVMRDGCQAHFRHAVPRRSGVRDLRINLTYRLVVRDTPDAKLQA